MSFAQFPTPINSPNLSSKSPSPPPQSLIEPLSDEEIWEKYGHLILRHAYSASPATTQYLTVPNSPDSKLTGLASPKLEQPVSPAISTGSQDSSSSTSSVMSKFQERVSKFKIPAMKLRRKKKTQAEIEEAMYEEDGESWWWG